MVEYDGDNSDQDPDYKEVESDPSSDSDEQDNGRGDMVVRAGKRYELKDYCIHFILYYTTFYLNTGTKLF